MNRIIVLMFLDTPIINQKAENLGIDIYRSFRWFRVTTQKSTS